MSIYTVINETDIPEGSAAPSPHPQAPAEELKRKRMEEWKNISEIESDIKRLTVEGFGSNSVTLSSSESAGFPLGFSSSSSSFSSS